MEQKTKVYAAALNRLIPALSTKAATLLLFGLAVGY